MAMFLTSTATAALFMVERGDATQLVQLLLELFSLATAFRGAASF